MKAVEVTRTMFEDDTGQKHELPEKALEADLSAFIEKSGGWSGMGCGEAAEIILRNRIVLVDMLINAEKIMQTYEEGGYNG